MRMRKSGRWAPNLDCERPAAWRGSSRVDRRRQLLRGCFGGRLARRFCHAASFAEPIGKSRFYLYALALARRSLTTADEYQARFATDRIARYLEKRGHS